jgi:hypothetical protein
MKEGSPLMAMTLEELMHTSFQKEISEGKHSAKLTSMQYVPNAKNRANDYITMAFDIDNGDCSYKRNQFIRDISIMLSHVRRQLGKAGETIQPTEFLQGLITDKTEFNIWFSYPTVMTAKGLRRTQNIQFIEPIAIAASSETPTDDSAELDTQAG